MIKTALKVLHTKSPENLYQALVNTKAEGEDEVKKLTEDDLRKMTTIQRKSWYRTLPRELHKMKPGTDGWRKRIDKWAKKI